MTLENSYQEQLINALRQAADKSACNWLEASLDEMRRSADLEADLLKFSGMARRKLGRGSLGAGVPCIETDSGALEISDWIIGDCGRIIMLLETGLLSPEVPREWVDKLFRQGDEAERSAIVRALVLLPSPESLKHLALEAGRGNSLRLYSALALRNPYPAACYEEHEFNQVVLKSLFTELNIEQVVGLEQRANAELSKMCEDYADERLAASRTVPADIWLAVWPYATEHGEELMLRFLDHEEPRRRYYAAVSIGRRQSLNPALSEVLEHRLSVETEPLVQKVLQAQLAG